jgi:hypothetical protein
MTVIDDIKDRIDILDVVSETVKLKKSGRTYVGFCPFREYAHVVSPVAGERHVEVLRRVQHRRRCLHLFDETRRT